MIQRDGYPAGVPCWADTSQPDPKAAVEFYSGLFGWECEDVMPADSPSPYFIARLHGGDVAAIGGSSETDGPPVWNTYISVDNADETAAKLWESGGEVLTEPFDVMAAGRMAVCADPEGAQFRLWQSGEHRGANIVNEPGSVNFNNLNVRDAERAKAFYGEVFGWGTLSLGPGAEMWTLPGYCDHLETIDPGVRQRMVDSGAPAGFEDVVAAMIPVADDQRPHWSLTFAVADADATAERAAELGATIVVAPFDAPWVRSTVITDPQGATFIASQFVPENRDIGSEAGAAPAAA